MEMSKIQFTNLLKFDIIYSVIRGENFMERDVELEIAFQQMRDTAKYYVDNLCFGNIRRTCYFHSEREKFEKLCKSHGCQVKWSEPRGWGSLECRLVPKQSGVPDWSFVVQSNHCLALSPHN